MPVWRTLARGTNKVSPANPSSLSRVSNLDLHYDPQRETMTFYGEVSSSSRPVNYPVILTFRKVFPTTGLKKDEIEQGYQPKPFLSKNDVQVRCGCPQYRFTFDWPNRDVGAGTGKKFGAYRRKTNRASVNPRNLPGFCKHLLTFVEHLQADGFIH